MVDIRRRIEAPVAVPRPVKASANTLEPPRAGGEGKNPGKLGKTPENSPFFNREIHNIFKVLGFFLIVMLVFFWGGGGSNMEPKVMEVLRSNVVPCQFGDL